MLKKFDLFATAPGAVGRLREVVLELAVTGKLLGIKSESWKEAVLGDIVSLISGQHLLGPDQNTERRGMPYLTGPADFGDLHPVPSRWTERPKAVAIPGDILITVKGAGVGKTNILDSTPTAISRQLMAVRAKDASPLFVHLILKRAASYFQRAMTGIAIPGIGRDDVLGLRLELPPLAEQQRIVAKVDELMAVCDRLEAQQRERDTRHATLARAALARFAAAPTPDNLQYLFHPSYDIAPDELRKVILSLAAGSQLTNPDVVVERYSLTSLLSEPSSNGVSKGPSSTARGTEILKISAGTSRDDFFVDEDDYKHVELPSDEISKHQLRKDDLLACRYNGNLHFVGKFSLYRAMSGRIQVNPDKLIRFRINKSLAIPRYVCYVMNAPQARLSIEALCATTAGNIGLSAGKLKEIVLPVPPLSEQHRIVAAVDRLLSLVDSYESQLATACDTATSLLDALVAELTGAVRPGAPAPSPASGAGRAPDGSDGVDANEPASITRDLPAKAPVTPDAGEGAVAPGEAGSRLLVLLRERGSLSSSEAQAATGLDSATLRGLFKTMIDQGLARTEGQRRGMKYLKI